MRNFLYIISVCCLVILILTAPGFSQNTAEIKDFVSRIKEVDKVERLYSIRYGLDRINELPNPTIDEQRELSNAYLALANAFKLRNHFRNAVDIYFDYLKLKEDYRKRYIGFVADSLRKVNLTLATLENDKIRSLDKEIATLNKQLVVVTGMKRKYFKNGGIAAVIILILAGMIFINRNNAINASLKQLGTNHLKLQTLYKSAGYSRMLVGSIEYAKQVVNENEEKISAISDYYNDKPNTPAYSESLKSLQRAGQVLKSTNS
jgi:hypothetical protein